MSAGNLAGQRQQPNTAPAVSNERQRPQLVNPFMAGTTKYDEAFGQINNAVITAPVQINDIKVPAGGYLRYIDITVTLSGGTGGSAVLRPDGIYNAIQSVTLRDTNGNPIVGPIPGHALYLINRFGGYMFVGTPPISGQGVDANGNGNFSLRLPVEASARDGYCALPNMNSAQPFRVDITLNSLSNIFSTPPATLQPTVSVSMQMNAWTQPAPFDLYGVANEQAPPGLGAMQYWTRSLLNINAGPNKVELQRTGQLFRNLIFSFYDTSSPPARNAGGIPLVTPLRYEVDNEVMHSHPVSVDMLNMDRAYGQPYVGGDALVAAVWAWNYCDDLDGHPGFEQRNQYFPTTGATKATLEGTFGLAGVLHVLTNDVAPAPVAPVGPVATS